LVLLSTKHLPVSPGLHHKFVPRFLGPFKIVRSVRDVSYELELPPQMKMHKVFHTSLLRPWIEPSVSGQFPQSRDHPLPPPVDPADDQWLVDTLLAKRKVGATGKWKYFVAWAGWPREHDCWVHESNIDPHLVRQLHDLLPDYTGRRYRRGRR
jgi:hypothetical protein